MICDNPKWRFPINPDCLSPGGMYFSFTRWASSTPKDATECNQPLTHFPRSVLWVANRLNGGRCPSQQSARAPAHNVGNMLIPGVGTGALGFVTSDLRGLSALFVRWSYCPFPPTPQPPSGLWRGFGGEPQCWSKDSKIGPGSKG